MKKIIMFSLLVAISGQLYAADKQEQKSSEKILKVFLDDPDRKGHKEWQILLDDKVLDELDRRGYNEWQIMRALIKEIAEDLPEEQRDDFIELTTEESNKLEAETADMNDEEKEQYLIKIKEKQ
ncbi:MAG: hypothetical protein WD055_06415 [Candidatus Dependentiae bacterium]